MCRTCKKILLENSETTTRKEAEMEWTYLSLGNLDMMQDIQHMEATNCICGQSILYKYLIKNKLNNKILILGSTCITDNYAFKKNHQLITDAQIDIELEQSYTCLVCDKKYLKAYKEKHLSSNKHKKNDTQYELNKIIEKKKKKYRICMCCLDYKIKLSTPEKFKYCYKYNLKVEQCIICGVEISVAQYKGYSCKCYGCIKNKVI